MSIAVYWRGRFERPSTRDSHAAAWGAEAGRRILFGLRLWLAVCLSLYLSFWLQLDNAYWSGVSAAVVSQPSLAAALRRGVSRLLGSVAGATALVVLAAFCIQDRTAFLVGLALWGGGCAFFATVLRDQASYAVGLAGFTAAIVAGGVLDASGQASRDVFAVALTRASEIWIGVVAATIVFVVTDVGQARRRLTESFAGLASDISAAVLKGAAPRETSDQIASLVAQQVSLLARIIGLDVQIAEAVGEDYDLRRYASTLRAGTLGFIAALANWRRAADGLARLPEGRLPMGVARVGELRALSFLGSVEPRDEAYCRAMRKGARQLLRLETDDPALQAAAIAGAEGLLASAKCMEALAALAGSRISVAFGRIRRRPIDLLPAVINAARAMLTIGGAELFWVESAWPDGGSAVAYAAVSVILFSPRGPQGYGGAKTFLFGAGLGVLLGGVVRFSLLPLCVDFGAFCVALALVLTPLGALSLRAGNGLLFTFAAVNFCVGLNAENVMSYDVASFYNQLLAIVVGCFAGAAALALLPSLSTDALVRRATLATARDIRELAAGRLFLTLEQWSDRIIPRLSYLITSADRRLLSQLASSLAAGAELIRLQRVAPRVRGLGHDMAPALAAIGDGEWVRALRVLSIIDDRLASVSTDRRFDKIAATRARAAIRGLLGLSPQPGVDPDFGLS